MNINDFIRKREELNQLILDNANMQTKRFFALDTSVYKTDVLDAKTKEMLGLVGSLVLRCDECIKYHILQCIKENVSLEEFNEIFNIGLIIGGSIIIPELRKAFDFIINNNLINNQDEK